MRYLAVAAASDEAAIGLKARLAGLVRTDPGLRVVIDHRRLLVLASKDLPVITLDARFGAVLGRIHDMGRTAPCEAFSQAEAEALIASRGRRLIERYWGGYVGFLLPATDEPIQVVRAPLGDLPCLYCKTSHAICLGSDADLLIEAGLLTPAICWTELARHLAASDIRRGMTCLDGLRELRGGERLSVARGDARRDSLWSPWTFARREATIDNHRDAEARVRDAVRTSCRSLLTGYDHPLLLLSGGIDSSILALCLGEAHPRGTALNFVSADPSGDERGYARLAAAAAGIDCIEAIRRTENVDLRRSDAARQPRPTGRSFQQDSARLAAAAAAAVGADILVDGTGGDNIFCGLQSVTPVADLILVGARTAAIMATARSIARIAEVSLGVVLAHGLHRAWFRPARTRWPRELGFLSAQAVRESAGAIDHPWLEPPPGALPGKAAHIALLVAGQSWVESLDPRDRPRLLSPLLSQPVAEACLRVPSWMWFDEGCNRAVARRAFAERLPFQIANRRSKATPDSFVHQLFDRYRPTLAEMLLEGRLATRGLLDRTAIERVLSDPRPAAGHWPQRLMRIADVEAWVDVWSTRADA